MAACATRGGAPLSGCPTSQCMISRPSDSNWFARWRTSITLKLSTELDRFDGPNDGAGLLLMMISDDIVFAATAITSITALSCYCYQRMSEADYCY